MELILRDPITTLEVALDYRIFRSNAEDQALLKAIEAADKDLRKAAEIQGNAMRWSRARVA